MEENGSVEEMALVFGAFSSGELLISAKWVARVSAMW